MQQLVRGLILGCTLLCAAAGAWAEPLLKDGDRLIFVGDSYVGQQGYTALVMDAYALHHPGVLVSFRTAPIRNVGFAAAGLLPFFPPLADTDVLSAKPTLVMLNFGLEKISTKPLDQAYFERWFVAPLTALVQKLQAAGVKVVLVTPGCPDLDKQPDLTAVGMPNVEQYAKAIREVADKAHAPVLDVFALMRDVQARGKVADRAFSLVQQDITLNASGNALVAGACLRTLCEDSPPSGVTIDATAGTVQAEHCKVKDMNIAEGTIIFTRADDTLPAYFPAAAAPALTHDPLLSAQEQYRLKVTGLKPGRWKVTAGGVLVGAFTADELAAGVNLARLPGPWQQLGARVHQFAVKQEALYAERCGTVAHLTTPPGAEPERLALLQKFDEYIDIFERERLAITAADRTWAWKVDLAP